MKCTGIFCGVLWMSRIVYPSVKESVHFEPEGKPVSKDGMILRTKRAACDIDRSRDSQQAGTGSAAITRESDPCLSGTHGDTGE